MECKLKNITIHYETSGEGRPIVMLHGWSLDHHHMMSAMESLFEQREGWRRIYPDLPGHGKTSGPDWITDQDRMLDAVLDFIDAVAPGQRFVVAGTSAGAYLARGVAYRRAASLDGLLMVVPLIVADDAKRTLPAHVTLVEDPALTADLTPEEADAFQLAVVQSRQVLDRLRANPALTVGLGDQDFLTRIRQDPERYRFSFDVDAPPEPFPGPALILAGRQDDSVGYRDAWEILENYPRGTFAVLDRAGHLLEIEQQALFQALVGEWLDRVEEYAIGTGGTA
jgi:pimeloyl-ACP methyl ester carboxylesterase